MKNFSILLALSFAALASLAPAQTARRDLLFDFGAKAPTVIGWGSSVRFTNVFGKFTVEAAPFFGIAATPVAGYGAIFGAKLADQVDLRFGPAFVVSSDRPRVGVFAGFTFRF